MIVDVSCLCCGGRQESFCLRLFVILSVSYFTEMLELSVERYDNRDTAGHTFTTNLLVCT